MDFVPVLIHAVDKFYVNVDNVYTERFDHILLLLFCIQYKRPCLLFAALYYLFVCAN